MWGLGCAIVKRQYACPPGDRLARRNSLGTGGLSVEAVSDRQELRNVECNHLSNSGQDELDRTESPEAASNSSVITSVGSSEDTGSVTVAGCVEESTGGVEMMNNGWFEDSTYGNDSVTLVKNIVASGNEVFQHELQEQFQVLVFNFFLIFCFLCYIFY